MTDRRYTFRLTSEGVEQLRKDLDALGAAGQRAWEVIAKSSPQAARAMDQAAEAADRARKKIADAAQGPAPGLKALAAAGDEVAGSFNAMAGRVPVVGAALTALGPVGVVGAAAIGGITSALVAGAREAAAYEQRYNRLQGVLRATGGAAGLTAQQIAAVAEELENSTMASEEAVLDAAAALATFKSVSGDAFTQTLKLAQDMSAVIGGDLRGNVIQLGKALEDPVQGLTALRRVGISFTEQQREQIRVLAESGRQLEARQIILRAVEGQIGGAGASERTGLTGAVKGLGDAWGDFLKEIGKTQGFMTDAVDAIAGGVRRIQQSLTVEGRLASVDAQIGNARRNPSGIANSQRLFGGGPLLPRLEAERAAIIAEIDDRDDEETRRRNVARDAAATAAAGAEADRIAAVTKATEDYIAAQARELELAKLVVVEREKAMAADKAEAEFKKIKKDATAEEIAQRRAAAVAVVEQRQATQALLDAEKQAEQERKKQQDEAVRRLETKAAALEKTEQQADAIRRETAAIGLDETERRVLTEVMAAENDLRRAGIDLQSEEARQRLANVAAAAREREARRKAVEEHKKAAEEAAKALERPWKNLWDNIQRGAGDLWTEFFEKGKISFERIGQLGRNILARLAGELASVGTMSLVRGGLSSAGIAIPGLGGAGGFGSTGGGIAGGGGFGGISAADGLGLGMLFSGTGSWLPQGMKDWIFSASLGLDSTGALGADLINGLGSTPYGIIGTLGAKLVGLNGSGNMLVDMGLGLGGTLAGGAIGTSMGTILGMAGGPVGAVIGAFAGQALASLFGGKSGFSGGQVNLAADAAGNLITTEAGFKRFDSAQALDAARQFVGQINALFDQLGLGFAPGPGNFANIGFGQGAAGIDETIRMLLRNGRLTSSSPDLTAAISRMDMSGDAEALLSRLADLVATFNTINAIDLNPERLTQTEQVLKAINDQFETLKAKAEDFGLSLGNLEAARAKALADVTAGFNESISQQILAISDPAAAALDALARAQEARLKEAEKAGADLVQVERLAALERERVVAQSNASIRQLLVSLTSGSASPLAPAATLSNAEARFSEVRAAALAGSGTARDALTGAAQDLLAASRTAFASSPEYFQRYDFVVATLRNILGGAPGFADGTASAPPGWAWVGERGRELVRFRGGEQVVPNHKLPDATAFGAELVRGFAVLERELSGLRRDTAETRELLSRTVSQFGRLAARPRG